MIVMENLSTLFVTLSVIIVGSFGSDFDLELIKEVNAAQTTWQAAENHLTRLSDEEKKHLLGAEVDLKNVPEKFEMFFLDRMKMPKSFDARLKWKKCPSLRAIKDQGVCGSCWAVASASVMSDRLCIASKNKVKVNISAEELITCCKECGSCSGGNVDKAWLYFIREGVVTGGDYESNEGCKPYGTENCGKNCTGTDESPTKPCSRHKCTNTNYHRKFKKDLHFGKNVYTIPRNTRAIQSEIYHNGPVTAMFSLYQDFYLYHTGVYQYFKGNYSGRHVVRILGWGTDKGTDYWLVANSWGPDWGEKGLFKIRRGTNEVTFEDTIVAGTVSVENQV